MFNDMIANLLSSRSIASHFDEISIYLKPINRYLFDKV